MKNIEKFLAHIDERFESDIIPELMDYIKLPALGPLYDANWQESGHLVKAMNLIKNWCKKQKFNYSQFVQLQIDNRTPLLFMEIPAFNWPENDKTHILMYGHMDKQPEMEGWTPPLGPWTPIRKGDLLYGRGGADDGYSTFSSLLALETLQKFDIPHPKCSIIIEGSEECGSVDLPFYVEHLKENYNLSEPQLVVCLDSGAGNFEQLWATTSLRGNITSTLEIKCLTEGIHSGLGSGIAPNPVDILRILLDRIQDPKEGMIILKDLFVKIPEQRLEQIKAAAPILAKEIPSTYPVISKVELHSNNNPVEQILRKTWYPSLSVTGIDGLPNVKRAGNVSIPQLKVKLSFRLPPTLNPILAAKSIEKTLCDNPPNNSQVSLHWDSHSKGWNAPQTAQWLDQAIQEAGSYFFKKPSQYMGEGGTIPFMGMLNEQFPKAQFLITGVLGPQSNAHGPNEFLHIEFTKKLTASIAAIIAKVPTK